MSAPPDTTADRKPAADTGEASATGLTFPQIAAGALAAATASILGSFLGVLGTIGGAAAASIVSTVGAALYQRSLERTRDKVKERLVVSPTGSQVAGAVARVTGQGRAGAAVRPGQAAGAGATGAGATGAGRPSGPGPVGPAGSRPVGGAPGPRPPGPGPMAPPPVAPRSGPAQHADRGRPLPPEQQLRAGGRTIATQVHAQAAPTQRAPAPRTPHGGIPNARGTGTPPGGLPPTSRMAPPGHVVGPPTAYVGDDATQVVDLGGPGTGGSPRRGLGKKTWFTLAGVAASVFVIGLLASFGVETAAGRPLSGGTSGTSVGSVFGQNTGTATATSEPSTTEEPAGGEETTSSSDGERSGSADPTGSNSGDGGSSPETTQRRTSSPDSGGDQQRDGESGGGAGLPSLLPRFSGGDDTNG